MRVLHVIPSVSPRHGGPSFAVKQMAQALVCAGLEVDVVTTTADGIGELVVPLGRPVVEGGVRYFYFPRQHPKFWTFSWPLRRWLLQWTGEYNVLHIHTLFSYPPLLACRSARRRGIPYLLRPLGTLDSWALGVHRWRKAAYFRLFERQNLLGAAAVHAASDQERRAIEALGLSVRVVTIPLGVDVPARAWEDRSAHRNGTDENSTVRLLFLSRLHPKKGIELLLDAVRLLPEPERVHLVIAGDGEPSYVNRLRRRVAANGLEAKVTFTGFVAGPDKWRLLQLADLFVLPSYDENFGMAVAEALSAGLPVIVSEHVGLAGPVAAAGAGVVVRCDPRELAQAIAVLVADVERRRRMGDAGRRLAQSEFSWPDIARRLAALYEEVTAARRGSLA